MTRNHPGCWQQSIRLPRTSIRSLVLEAGLRHTCLTPSDAPVLVWDCWNSASPWCLDSVWERWDSVSHLRQRSGQGQQQQSGQGRSSDLSRGEWRRPGWRRGPDVGLPGAQPGAGRKTGRNAGVPGHGPAGSVHPGRGVLGPTGSGKTRPTRVRDTSAQPGHHGFGPSGITCLIRPG